MFKVGDTLYIFDPNLRVYAKDAKGKPTGAMIYREHFYSVQILGETARSWITSHGAKFPKRVRRGYLNTGLYTLAEVEAHSWREAHHYRIVEAVRDVRDVGILRGIAKLIGYCEVQP